MAILDIRTGKPIAAPTTTRRKVLGGLAGILATGAAPAAIIRSALAARTAALSGSASPHTYLEYLHIGSGQWVDPNITLNQTMTAFDSVDANMRVTALGGELAFYFGGWNPTTVIPSGATGAGSGIRRCSTYAYLNIFLYHYGNNPRLDFGYQINVTSKTCITSDFISCGWKKITDGVQIYWDDWYSDNIYYKCDYIIPFCIGALLVGGSYEYNTSQFDLAQLTIKDIDGNLTHDFRPVLRHADSKYCIYDEVTGLYHLNGGTGEFTPPT